MKYYICQYKNSGKNGHMGPRRLFVVDKINHIKKEYNWLYLDKKWAQAIISFKGSMSKVLIYNNKTDRYDIIEITEEEAFLELL